jgi:DNA-binding NarL/FixJ family response regulator
MFTALNVVSFHLKDIYDKLQAHSKTEAVAKALREHLIEIRSGSPTPIPPYVST